MTARYEIGQKVKVKPGGTPQMTPGNAALDVYAGQTGEVIDYYWISPHDSEIFYIYKIRIEAGFKEIALYEDEIEADRG